LAGGAFAAGRNTYGAQHAVARNWQIGTTAELAGIGRGRRRSITVANQGAAGTEIVYLLHDETGEDRPVAIGDAGGSTPAFAIPNGESITVTGVGAWWIISDTAATLVAVLDEYDD
jgi:hypothetical protein